jgi:hypothetical protein
VLSESGIAEARPYGRLSGDRRLHSTIIIFAFPYFWQSLLKSFSFENDKIIVKNNLQLKLTTIESNGLGHKSINSQYLFLFNKEIQIESNTDFYIVRLPIIEKI